MNDNHLFPATLILLRHGHVEGISPERFRGRTDLPLTALGHHQVQQTVAFIASQWSPDVIYSSPLKRCMDTAAAIAEHLGLKVQPSEQLIDINYGLWQGETVENVAAKDSRLYESWRHHPHLTVIKDAETLADVQARIVRAFNQMCQKHPGGTVLAVGHDSTIKIFLCLILDLPLSAYWRIKQDPCAVNVLKLEGQAYQARALNGTAHLKGYEQSCK